MTITLSKIGNAGYTLTAEPGAEYGVTLWFRPPTEVSGAARELAILLTQDEVRQLQAELDNALVDAVEDARSATWRS